MIRLLMGLPYRSIGLQQEHCRYKKTNPNVAGRGWGMGYCKKNTGTFDSTTLTVLITQVLSMKKWTGSFPFPSASFLHPKIHTHTDTHFS